MHHSIHRYLSLLLLLFFSIGVGYVAYYFSLLTRFYSKKNHDSKINEKQFHYSEKALANIRYDYYQMELYEIITNEN